MSTRSFLQTVFAGLVGHTPVAYFNTPNQKFAKGAPLNGEKWFKLPEQLDDMVAYVEARTDLDLYFSPYVFTKTSRKAEYTAGTNVVHADIDSCPLDQIKVDPSILWRTSPGSHQAVWFVQADTVAERQALGKSMWQTHKTWGWDAGHGASKLLRIPGTTHNKTSTPHRVVVVEFTNRVYSVDEVVEYYPPVAPAAATLRTDAADREEPDFIPDSLAKRLNEIPEQGRRSEQRVAFIKFAVEWGKSTPQILYMLDEHIPTQEKYQGDRHVQYSIQDIENHRALHNHEGENCAEAHPDDLQGWWADYAKYLERKREKFANLTERKKTAARIEEQEKQEQATEAHRELREAKTSKRLQLPSPKQPAKVAERLRLVWSHRPTKLARFRRYRATWLVWTGTQYRELTEEEFAGRLWGVLKNAFYVDDSNGFLMMQEFNPTTSKVREVTAGLKSELMLSDLTTTNSWIGTDPGHGTVVPAKNGLVRLSDRTVMDHTPQYFNLTSVPFDYDAAAECPNWLAFLAEQWGEDPESTQLLQEFFGLVISGKTSFQKALQLIGPKRSGKSTIMRILTALVGANNVVGPTLQDFSQNFGLSMMTDKTLAVIGDARGRIEGQTASKLLSITGEDVIQVDRKNRDPWSGKLPVRLVILSNELVNFGDPTLVSRFLTIKTTRSFIGQEDTTLGERLNAELAGILNWAIEGLERLEARGHFVQPESTKYLVEAQTNRSSSLEDFLEEYCAVAVTAEEHQDKGFRVTKDELFSAWRAYCQVNNIQDRMTKQTLTAKLGMVDIPGARIKGARLRGDGGKLAQFYTGIKLVTYPTMVPNDLSGLVV